MLWNLTLAQNVIRDQLNRILFQERGNATNVIILQMMTANACIRCAGYEHPASGVLDAIVKQPLFGE